MTAEEEWLELCEEHDEAMDEVNDALANRTGKVYENGDFWERVIKAQEKYENVRKKMDDFRNRHRF